MICYDSLYFCGVDCNLLITEFEFFFFVSTAKCLFYLFRKLPFPLLISSIFLAAGLPSWPLLTHFFMTFYDFLLISSMIHWLSMSMLLNFLMFTSFLLLIAVLFLCGLRRYTYDFNSVLGFIYDLLHDLIWKSSFVLLRTMCIILSSDDMFCHLLSHRWGIYSYKFDEIIWCSPTQNTADKT